MGLLPAHRDRRAAALGLVRDPGVAQRVRHRRPALCHRLGGAPHPLGGRAGPNAVRGPDHGRGIRTRRLLRRLHHQPAAGRPARDAHLAGPRLRRTRPDSGTGRPGPAARPAPLPVEERQVGPRHHAQPQRCAGLVRAAGLPQLRRSLAPATFRRRPTHRPMKTHGRTNPMTAPRRPAVLIHGLWLHATSWTPWLDLFRDAGYEPVAPGWPHEPATVEEARNNPDLVADLGIDDVTDHYAKIIAEFGTPPVLIGHSFGGLITEKLLGLGIGAAGVAIDPAQIKGVLPLPLAQLRAGLPALGNPANLHKAISLTKKEFRFGFGNAVSEEASDALYDAWTIPSPAKPLFQAAVA